MMLDHEGRRLNLRDALSADVFISGRQNLGLQDTDETFSALPARQHVVAVDKNNVYTRRIYIVGGCCMGTARVFRSGNSQAVRLPKQFRLKSKEVEIFRRGDEIVLREKHGNIARAFELLAGLPEDVDLVGREKDRPQKRRGL